MWLCGVKILCTVPVGTIVFATSLGMWNIYAGLGPPTRCGLWHSVNKWVAPRPKNWPTWGPNTLGVWGPTNSGNFVGTKRAVCGENIKK